MGSGEEESRELPASGGGGEGERMGLWTPSLTRKLGKGKPTLALGLEEEKGVPAKVTNNREILMN